ncbi:MAG TPA: molybdopterin-dependent oxidoreductase [Vicinamibacterales bacterium]|nr:molybdopterin-dependent oxidoreductase [Vicinamibacterales bacterium]
MSEVPDQAIETACPLDCPDSCSLSVKVKDGQIAAIDGSDRNPTTAGFICDKVRRFAERVEGEDRLRHPAVRVGAKGQAAFSRLGWDEAIDLLAARLRETRDRWGGEAILPFSYGGSNGLLTQDTADARLFDRLGASRLARTVCAAPTGAALQALYGGMPSTSYPDYESAALIVVWGANPAASGIHLLPYLQRARKRGARLVVVDPRATPLARHADLHVPVTPGTDLPVALAIHRHLFEAGRADAAFLAAHARGAAELRERAAEWPFERAASVAGVQPDLLRQFADLYASSSPALIRCGWGLERNRNGGSAAAAVLALPAVAGKFGVRGGGFSMSNSGAWGIRRTWMEEPGPQRRIVNMNHLGRALTEYDAPPVKLLFVYNSNPLVTVPDQARILEGLAREDLFTVVFDQVMTDTAAYADLVLPATTFLEHYDLARAYGPISLQMVRPVIDGVGEARSNPDVFGALLSALDLAGNQDQGELETLLEVMDALPAPLGQALRDDERAQPAFGSTPVQFVDVRPGTADGRVDLFPESMDSQSDAGLYRYLPDPGTDQYPLALISPASERTISSTLGELRRPQPTLAVHPVDARARQLEEGEMVRVFNALGEVHCPVSIEPTVRPGTVSLAKGLWRRSTANGFTGTVLVPDTLTDIAGGACFNDARVQVERLGARG